MSEEYYRKYIEPHTVPQNMQFMIDLLPTIRELTRDWPRGKEMSVLDVGSGAGAGSNLLAQLYIDDFFRFPMRVEALDFKEVYADFIKQRYPLVNFHLGNIWDMEDNPTHDLVICSHVIEHFKHPKEVIRKASSRAKHWAVFYTPHNEQNRISEHHSTITDDIVDSFNPIVVKYMESHAWHPGEPCVIFVVKGQDER